jgi:hypothetical protein
MPVGAVTVIVPVGVAQVGCVNVAVGVAGAPGAALMVALNADDVQAVIVLVVVTA